MRSQCGPLQTWALGGQHMPEALPAKGIEAPLAVPAPGSLSSAAWIDADVVRVRTIW